MMLNERTIITSILQLVLAMKIREELTPAEWVKVLLIANQRGYLYYGFKDDKISKVAIAYRVPEITEDTDENMPYKEEGDILWVANFISIAKESVRSVIKDFFKQYKDINEIAFEDPKGKVIRIKREILNEQKEKH